MTAEMKIIGWQSKGLRCPDHEIDLLQKEDFPYQISLIQMPNGTGKTTTLELLRAALCGNSAWSAEEIKELAKKDGSPEKGSFEVILLLNNKRFTIMLEFDFVEGEIKYKTTTSGQGGQDIGFNPPREFNRFMKDEFVNFFVFDGELAQNLLDKNHTDAESVVEILFQVDLLRKLSKKVDFYWDHKTKDVSAKGERGQSAWNKKVETRRLRLNELTQRRDKGRVELEQIKEEIDLRDQEYESEIEKTEDLKIRHTAAQIIYETAENDVKLYAREVLDMMANPHALAETFSNEMMALKQGLDRVKLPESAAREFFVELADEKKCICGRPIDKKVKETILQRSVDYLASDEVSLLNSMKTAVDEAINGANPISPDDLDQKIADLERLRTEAQEAKTNLEAVQEEINKADPDAKRISDELVELQERKEKVEAELSILEGDSDEDDEDSECIKVLERLLEQAEEKLEEITDTIDLRNKRDLLKEILEQAYSSAQLGITEDICDEANKRVEKLMPNNGVRIEKIEKCLVLAGQSGGSAGEQLSIAYAFLSTLFSRSEHELPFVVDSPAGPIDLAIRPKIGNLIPNLTDQFVAFTISSEREGFVPALKKANSQSMQFLTVFKTGNAELEKAAKKVKNAIATADGYVVPGEKFFNAFQIDEE